MGDIIRNKEGIDFMVTSATSSTYFGEENVKDDKSYEIAFKEDNPILIKKAVVRPITNIKDVVKGMLIRDSSGLFRVYSVGKYDDGWSIRLVKIKQKRKPRSNDFMGMNNVKENLEHYNEKLEIIEETKETKRGLFKWN